MLRLRRIALCACAAFSLAAAGRPVASSIAQGQAALARLPLRFEANQGQFAPEVRFAARTGGYSLLLTDRGAGISIAGAPPVSLHLLHARRASAIEPLDDLGARTDYFVGRRANWHTGIHNYAKVRYTAVYPGIDMVYYGSQGQLEYDFVLSPGADPRAIRLRFDGASRVAIDSDGDLTLATAGGSLTQKRPVIYQQDPATGARRTVSGRYVMLARNVVGLKLDGYDRSRSLVIDPVLVYSTYMGGSLTDRINAARLDSHGLLYLVGQTDTTGSTNSYAGDLPATGNYSQPNSAGITDAFLAIVDTTGANGNYGLVYFTYLGGSNIDIANALQVDSQGNAYIIGTTSSTDFPMVGNSVQTTGAATTRYAFIAVLSQAGGLEYSTYLGGTGGDTLGIGIDIDAAGNIYVIGTTKANDYPVTTSAYAGVLYGPQDVFLAEFNQNGSNLTYSTFIGGELDDWGIGIVVNPKNGLVYFAAQTVSTQFALGPGSYQVNLKGLADPVVGVMDFTKSGNDSLVYSTYFGGSDNDAVRGICLDASGNIVITGYSLSNDFPVTGNALQTTNRGNGDAFVSVLNPFTPSNFVVYSTYLGGADGEVAYGVSADSSGNLYVSGYTLSNDFPVTLDTLTYWGNGIDVFVTKFKPGSRAATWSTYAGGATVSAPTSMVVGPDGRVYVVGWSGGQIPLGNAPYQPNFGGGYSDGFILVLADK